MKIIDISIPLTEGMINYPGTKTIKIKEARSSSGAFVESVITMTSHDGTHVDAPLHSIPEGLTIDKLDLEKFYGPCRVLNMRELKTAVTRDALERKNIQAGERILLRTANSDKGFDDFFDDYVFLDPDGAKFLAEKQASLVGIDALGIKQKGAKDNSSHSVLLSQGIPILEGLNLKDVEEGQYTLIAFPLAFEGIDGSPVRAILLSEN